MLRLTLYFTYMPNNSKRVVDVSKRSGFDLTHRNSGTADVGTIFPLECHELIPDSKESKKINIAVTLPPLVTETFMNCRLRVEAFAVPHRLLYKGFESFFSDYPGETWNGNEFGSDKRYMPLIKLDCERNPGTATPIAERWVYLHDQVKAFKRGNLLDYLGYQAKLQQAEPRILDDIPSAPLVAYHLIWQEWYRNPRVQRPAFAPSGVNHSDYQGGTEGNSKVAFSWLPCEYILPSDGNFESNPIITAEGDGDINPAFYECADGVSCFSLRQRNFGLDFFTAAMVEPQQGPAAVVKFGDNGDPADGFTIASLRAQNSIQQFRERNNLTSPRYQQQIYARYGCMPKDGVLQRPALIGAATYDVYTNGVVSSQSTDNPAASGAKNPFNGQLGSRAGSAYASGSDFIIEDFHTLEPCYIMVLASLVPEVSYTNLRNPIFNRYKGLGSITDMANGILQNVGPQPIYSEELAAHPDPDQDNKQVFAYTDRYSDWMYMNNEVHGLFADGESLSAYVLQRSFDGMPEFGSEFLEIPKDYLDQVFAVSAETMGFGFMYDAIIETKVSMPLQEYAIPSLQDPAYEHGRSIVLRKNGQLL